jgi:ABC-type nitrate/sulfonate/bicarbonate transport system substrate-binding protein
MRAILALFLAAALAALQPAAAGAVPLKIRIGWLLVPAEITPILFPQDGIAKHLGTSYVLDPQRFQGSPLLISALAAGELDVAPFGYSSFALAVENGGMTRLRIFADEDRDGVGGHFTTQYMVRNDGGIKTIEDLKGKVFATNAAGSIGDMPVRVMLRRNGLDPSRDVTTVEVALPNMNAMLEGRKANLIISVLPFYLAPRLQSSAHTLFTSREAMGPAEISMLTASDAFLSKHRAAMTDFLEDYLRALHWYLDPANHDAAIATVAKFLRIPPERFKSWAFTPQDYYRAPDARVDVAALQKNVDVQHALGFLPRPLDVKPYVDMSLAEAAGRRLNK